MKQFKVVYYQQHYCSLLGITAIARKSVIHRSIVLDILGELIVAKKPLFFVT